MRLFTTIAALFLVAVVAVVFSGYAFAGQTNHAAASSGFGSNHAERVQSHPIERWLGGGHLKQVRCPVSGTLTVCYESR